MQLYITGTTIHPLTWFYRRSVKVLLLTAYGNVEIYLGNTFSGFTHRTCHLVATIASLLTLKCDVYTVLTVEIR